MHGGGPTTKPSKYPRAIWLSLTEVLHPRKQCSSHSSPKQSFHHPFKASRRQKVWDAGLLWIYECVVFAARMFRAGWLYWVSQSSNAISSFFRDGLDCKLNQRRFFFCLDVLYQCETLAQTHENLLFQPNAKSLPGCPYLGFCCMRFTVPQYLRFQRSKRIHLPSHRHRTTTIFGASWNRAS